MKKDMSLPSYTRGEEIIHMTTHIVGGGLGLVAMLACVIVAAYHQNGWGITSGIIYGFTVILLFTMSSIYHGLKLEIPKRVFRVLDHCMIYVLIAGTYTPIVLGAFRVAFPLDAWLMFGIIWGFALIGTTLTAIDRNRFKIFAIICYLGMGWMAMFRINRLVEILGVPFLVLLVVGGGLYTVGVLFYALGKRVKYMHSVFHLFVNAASIIHSVAIAAFVMPM
ncbi:MAG: hemolysin III family protein [Defluviitaleaceae bacterium]|nr:hemolysin III family protein [Defluviitaleaceae bacterium]MCL2239706.1 hemolysin III family protein [Defluviitaleaceae bacterium]